MKYSYYLNDMDKLLKSNLASNRFSLFNWLKSQCLQLFCIYILSNVFAGRNLYFVFAKSVVGTKFYTFH